MALGLCNLAKYLVVTAFFRYAWRYWLDFLVWECIIISYRSTLKFVPVEWFFAKLQPLGFEIWLNIQLSPLFFAMLADIDLIFGMRVYNHKLQINFEIQSGWMIFCQLTAVELWNLPSLFFPLWFEILTWFLVCEFNEAWGCRS
jgi:hypothetical protein